MVTRRQGIGRRVNDNRTAMSASTATVHHNIFLGASVDLLVLDDQCRVIEANPVALRLLGTDPGSVAGRPFTDLVATESVEPVAEALHEPLGSGGASPALWVAMRDGTPLTMVAVSILFEPERRLVVQLQRREEAAETERRLHDEEQRHRTLFTWAPVALRETRSWRGTDARRVGSAIRSPELRGAHGAS